MNKSGISCFYPSPIPNNIVLQAWNICDIIESNIADKFFTFD